MLRQAITLPLVAMMLGVMYKTGGFKELISFGLTKDTALLGGIISNVVVVILFSELYWILDQSGEEGEHFGFETPLDAYYFGTVTSSSVGYGDFLPRSKKAKILTIVHIMTLFFVILPIILEALKPGN